MKIIPLTLAFLSCVLSIGTPVNKTYTTNNLNAISYGLVKEEKYSYFPSDWIIESFEALTYLNKDFSVWSISMFEDIEIDFFETRCFLVTNYWLDYGLDPKISNPYLSGDCMYVDIQYGVYEYSSDQEYIIEDTVKECYDCYLPIVFSIDSVEEITKFCFNITLINDWDGTDKTTKRQYHTLTHLK
jgi:hypothetical protein